MFAESGIAACFVCLGSFPSPFSLFGPVVTMNHRRRHRLIVRRLPLAGVIAAASVIIAAAHADAQNAGEPTSSTKDPSSIQRTPFAPGVVTVIPPSIEPEETFDGPLTLQTFLRSYPEVAFGGDSHPNGKPHFDPRSRTLAEQAKSVILRREIFCFEFAFKPLRQIYIDLPQPNGKLKRKLIWYMVYQVRYVGKDLQPAAKSVGGSRVLSRLADVHYQQRRFFPSLVLSDEISNAEYLDRILPAATSRIRVREQITAPLYNSIEITRQPVPYRDPGSDAGVWGVATWEDVDPTLDFVSVEVYGLTNAFEIDGEGPEAPYRRKALQLNFYRPGDTIDPTEDKIRFGVPAYSDPQEQQYILQQYGLTERLDYRWIFR